MVLKKKIDIQLGEMIFATNSSFRIVEHPKFKRFCSGLRPGYQPPNRHKIGNEILEEVFQTELEKSKKEIVEKSVCLDIDGWSNTHNEPIICASITFEDGTNHLVSTIDTSGNPHNAEYLEKVVKETIAETEERFNCKISSIVTDNAANMKKMREEMIKENVISYGCAAHYANLLASDIHNTMSNVSKHIVKILKFFRNKHQPAALLKQAGGSKLIMPAETRWNTLADSIDSYLKNWTILFNICEDKEEYIDNDIILKVTNIGLKRSAEDILKILKPIAISLDMLQSDTTKIADVVEIWKNLINELSNIVDSDQMDILKKRYSQIVTPYHLLAYKLTPKYLGKNITQDENNEIMEFVETHYSSMIPLIIKLETRSSSFKNFLFLESTIKNVTCTEWWKYVDIEEKNFKVIESLMIAKGSSAGVERIFSTFGLVQSKLRNRLGNEKAGKLVYLFKQFNK